MRTPLDPQINFDFEGEMLNDKTTVHLSKGDEICLNKYQEYIRIYAKYAWTEQLQGRLDGNRAGASDERAMDGEPGGK